MKQIKNLFALAVFTLVSFKQLPAADTPLITNAVPVELKYAGTVKNQPLILMNFSGSKSDNSFGILVTDDDGVVLFNGDVKGEHFTKQFILNIDELGNAVLHFEITSKKSGNRVKYRVSNKDLASPQTHIVKL